MMKHDFDNQFGNWWLNFTLGTDYDYEKFKTTI